MSSALAAISLMQNCFLCRPLFSAALGISIVIIAAGQSGMNEVTTDRTLNFGSSLSKSRKQKNEPGRRFQIAPPNNNEDDVIRVETDLFVTEVRVTDRSGKPVSGLSRTDFYLDEDGQPKSIGVFANGDVGDPIPRAIVLVIDHSHSQLPYLETSVDAAVELVRMLNPNDRIAVVTDNVELLVNFTSDKQAVVSKLWSLKDRIKSGEIGKSRQYDALMAAVSELFEDLDVRPIVIFQTDGDQFTALGQRRPMVVDVKNDLEPFTHQDVIKKLEDMGTTVYSVIPGHDLSKTPRSRVRELAMADLNYTAAMLAKIRNLQSVTHTKTYRERFLDEWPKAKQRDADSIALLAEKTGGFSQYLERPDQAPEIYARILAEINGRYLIGYYPDESLRDGKPRIIRIKVNNQALRLQQARRSYTPSYRNK